MKFSKLALSAVGASIAMFASAPVFAAAHTGKPMAADDAASMTTRAEVKQDVKAAKASGELLPAGEKSTPQQGKGREVPKGSKNTRAEVKQEAKSAKSAGEALPNGERITPLPGQKQVKGGMGSVESRSEVKKEAVRAEKSGSAVQPGEALTKEQQKGMKQ